MLPNTKDLITLFPQKSKFIPVSRNISFNLRYPLFFGQFVFPLVKMPSMPKITINKNQGVINYLAIRFSKQLGVFAVFKLV